MLLIFVPILEKVFFAGLNSSINEESCSNSYSQSAVFYASFDVAFLS